MDLSEGKEIASSAAYHTCGCCGFWRRKEIADLEEAPGASQDADRLRRADQRGFFLHRAIFFSTEEERGGIAALAGQRNADRVCDSAIVKVEF